MRLRLSRKGERRRHEGWTSAYVKPSGKFWKRRSSKRIRRLNDIRNGNNYKKFWGWFEWS